MKKNPNLKEQLRRNAVALISLVVAITSLGYNTWRNEASEHNRNQRLVSIEVLRNLGELQQVVFHLHYDGDSEHRGNPRTGWAIVLTVHDLAMVLEQPVLDAAESLKTTWGENWARLGTAKGDPDAIIEQLESMRGEVHALLRSLD